MQKNSHFGTLMLYHMWMNTTNSSAHMGENKLNHALYNILLTRI